MFQKIGSLLKNKLTVNLFYIGIIKFINIFSKYILLSYLVRTFGEENYGIVTWVDSFIQYFLILINFGFDMYAAKYIVENKQDKSKLNQIISTIITIKVGLFFISLLLLSLFSFTEGISKYIDFMYLMLLMGIGEVLFPFWYFQGIEKMKPIAIVTLVSKGLLVILTIVFVKKPEQILLYISLLVLTNIVWGGLGFFFMKKESDFKFIAVSFNTIITYLKEGYLFFLGKFSTLFLNFGTIFLIGYFCSKNLVAGFDIASKIIFAFVFPFEVIQQAVFPVIVRSKNKLFVQRLILFTLCSGIVCSSIIYLFSKPIMVFFGGVQMSKYAFLLESLVILIPVISCTIIIGCCSLVAFGAIKQYNYSLVISCLCYVFGVFVLYVSNEIKFMNLLVLRISIDIIMVLLIFYFSLKKKTLL